MPKRNETEFIKNANKRQLTAKGQKFLDKCIAVACEQRGLTRYHASTKPLKDKLTRIIKHLFIDQGLGIEEIKTLIKNRDTPILGDTTN